jgi:hypothetical protein
MAGTTRNWLSIKNGAEAPFFIIYRQRSFGQSAFTGTRPGRACDAVSFLCLIKYR